jgi:LysR family pca operon transcriptional activator
MTQPAVSRALAELEAIMDVALFDRSRRALSLTSSGELLVRYAQEGLATLQQGLDTVAMRSAATVVAFGALPTVAAGIVPRALHRFAQSPFACRARVESGPSPYLLGLLRTAAIEFVVGRLASADKMDGLSFDQLYSEQLVLVVRPGHPLANRTSLSLQDVAPFQMVLPPRGAIIRPEIDALLIAGGVSSLNAEVETVSNSLGRAYTLMTDAVWAISSGVVANDLAQGTLTSLSIDMRATRGSIGITTRSGAELSPPARELIACIRALEQD